MSDVEERSFVEQLEEAAGFTSSEALEAVAPLQLTPGSYGAETVLWKRDHVSTVVSALRAGATLDSMLSVAPGLKLDSCLYAYVHVEMLRAECENSWRRLVVEHHSGESADPLDRFRAHLLVPSAVKSLDGNPAESVNRVESLTEYNRSLQQKLSSAESEVAAERVAAELFSLTDNSTLWADDHFLPSRVGELHPTKVASVLGENSRATV